MNTKKLSEDLSVSPQVSLDDLPKLYEAGFKSIICNRPDGETANQPTFREIRIAGEAVNLEVRYLPVVPGQINNEDVETFVNMVQELPKPTLAYCLTGNRSATLWKLSQADNQSRPNIFTSIKSKISNRVPGFAEIFFFHIIWTILVLLTLIIGIYFTSTVFAQQGHKHDHKHDETTMPGLRGENASDKESEDIRVMFRNFHTITREVENLANGIRTTTRSSDPAVMSVLISHVVDMIDRVEQLNDPKIAIQSPTLDIFFLRGDEIETSIDVTDLGIVVVQTSSTPALVTALQTHAAEVSDMADRGMDAVHDMMQKQGRGH